MPLLEGDRSSRFVEARLRAGHEAELELRGASMTPALRDGDRLRVRPFSSARPPAPGEIVVARRGPRLVTHRLLALDGGLAVTRGDACARPDPPIEATALLGRVVAVERRGLLARALRRARRLLSSRAAE